MFKIFNIITNPNLKSICRFSNRNIADKVTIRKARRTDCYEIQKLFVEHAQKFKLSKELTITVKDLEKDGFLMKPPLFYCLVAEQDKQVKGVAMYFFTYSSWKGKTIYLEDLCVAKDSRKQHIGSKLFNAIARVAYDECCIRLDFAVLDKNPAKQFYFYKGAYDATDREGWKLFRLERNNIKKIL